MYYNEYLNNHYEKLLLRKLDNLNPFIFQDIIHE